MMRVEYYGDDDDHDGDDDGDDGDHDDDDGLITLCGIPFSVRRLLLSNVIY